MEVQTKVLALESSTRSRVILGNYYKPKESAIWPRSQGLGSEASQSQIED